MLSPTKPTASLTTASNFDPGAGDSGTGRHGLFVRYNAELDALVFINPMAGMPAASARDASSASESVKDGEAIP